MIRRLVWRGRCGLTVFDVTAMHVQRNIAMRKLQVRNWRAHWQQTWEASVGRILNL